MKETMNDLKLEKATRRQMLKCVAVGVGLVAIPTASSRVFAADKATKAAMQYQDTPKGKQQCDNCIQFIPGSSPSAKGTCKVVEGDISPRGWCAAYAPKK